MLILPSTFASAKFSFTVRFMDHNVLCLYPNLFLPRTDCHTDLDICSDVILFTEVWCITLPSSGNFVNWLSTKTLLSPLVVSSRRKLGCHAKCSCYESQRYLSICQKSMIFTACQYATGYKATHFIE